MYTVLRSSAFIILGLAFVSCAKSNDGSPSASPTRSYSVPLSAKSSAQWSNYSLPASSGQSGIDFDVTPDQDQMDATTSLSSGPASADQQGEIQFHFDMTGEIQASNNDQLEAKVIFKYHAGHPVHFHVDLDAQSKTYTATVSSQDQAAVTLAENYSLKSTADVVINDLGLQANVGDETVNNFQLSVQLQEGSTNASSSASGSGSIQIPGLIANADLSANTQSSAISVQQDGLYEFDASVMLNSAEAQFHLEIDGQDASGPLVATQLTVSGQVILGKGDHSLKVVLDQGSAEITAVQFKGEIF